MDFVPKTLASGLPGSTIEDADRADGAVNIPEKPSKRRVYTFLIDTSITGHNILSDMNLSVFRRLKVDAAC